MSVKISKRLGAIVLATAGSLSLLAAPAEAAQGHVIFTNSTTGANWFLANPSPGCHQTGEFDTVRNSTDTQIMVFEDKYCQDGWPTVVQPGGAPTKVGPRQSVYIPR